ncbi:DNA polymerase III subunit delta [Lacimicrobium alkaliphilum]|uniref:DNA polymerase III subunit delta n=1 Tax=Lacimicrobium alkaliphilum TaxID=1526571 RepID=A0A0U3AA97_9ALTE|nr:DNA polymerase III subunit delta [Lacimicrobium alkaliphilum]ALS97934.1 DNA polymerase III subunit delta [Lacimicrobium alkaliphilum]
MQLYPNRLTDSLNKGLQAFYLIFGDEPQQQMECIQAVRDRARAEGFDERQSLTVDTGFNWNSLIEASQTLSLFSSRQMIELELATGKPGAEGAKVLQSLAQSPNPDVLILIHGGRIGKDVQNTKWFKSLDQHGVFIPCYPLEGQHLNRWISERLQKVGIQAFPELVKLLSDYCEGNLLAARQEIEKLALIYPSGQLTLEQAEKAIVDQSRFTVFQLIDVLLAGDPQRAVKMLYRLETEGVEPTIVLWALVREWQTLRTLQQAVSQGAALHSLWNQHRIWRNRQPLYQQALQRLDSNQLSQMADKLACFDQAIKQSSVPRPYIELCHLCLMFIPMPLADIALDYN